MITMEPRTDVVHFEHNGVKYAMTEQEIEAAYRYQMHQYRLEDARRHLNIFVFGVDDGGDFDDPEYEEDKANFAVAYGITYTDALSDYMLEECLRRFEGRFDCNYGENGQWEAAIRATLEDMDECDHICISCEQRAVCNGSTYKPEWPEEMEEGEDNDQ